MSARPFVLVGAVIGLTWAAALRGWMAQMASTGSDFHWYGTFALVLAPGLLVGALIGLAEHRRRTGGARSRWLILSPLLFVAALADPAIFRLLITTGQGGGAIGVALLGLAGGFALSGRGPTWWRRTCGTLALLGLLLMLVMDSDTAELGTPRGTWIGLYAASLMAVLYAACAIPHSIGRARLVPARWVAVVLGAVCGFAWAAALRAFMWEVAGSEASVEWAGTFLWVLLPSTVIGALLGYAEHRRWSGGVPYRRLLVWSPMLFAALLLQNPRDLTSGFEDGIGLGAIAVPTICMLGGYAVAGRGPRWVRGACGLVLVSTIPVWSLTATDVGGAAMSVTTPSGAWAGILYWGLLATFSLAAAIPHRLPVPDSVGLDRQHRAVGVEQDPLRVGAEDQLADG